MHHPERTAISRAKPSTPIQKLANETDLLQGDVLDYGCGKGADVLFLESKRGLTYAWDPNFLLTTTGYEKIQNSCPWTKPTFDTIVCTYVLNVLPPAERKKVISHVLTLLNPGGKAIFSARGPKDRTAIKGRTYKDGVITQKGTFQRVFSAKQLQSQIPGSSILFDEPGFVSVVISP